MIDSRAGTLDRAPELGAVRQRGALAAGIFSGLLAGAVMAAFMVAAASGAGMPPAELPKAIGTTFVGAGALGETALIVYATALHALASVVVGLAYAAVVPRDLPPASAAVLGLGYALFVAGIMASLVLPTVNPGFLEHVQPVGGSVVIGHVLYGIALGLSHRFLGSVPRGNAAGG